MKDSLRPGIGHTLEFTVTEAKTVPRLYPESPDFAAMPAVFATGFMVGLMEWACIEALKPHVDDGEGSLGVHIDVTHTAATPPGMTVTVAVRCTGVEGRRVAFEIEARDDVEPIGAGRHERFVVAWDRFAERLARKTAGAED